MRLLLVEVVDLLLPCCLMVDKHTIYEHILQLTVSQAYFALYKTLHKVQNFREKKVFFGTKVTSDAFLSTSQHLKVTRLQGYTQTKL
jgi:hypothetical protein